MTSVTDDNVGSGAQNMLPDSSLELSFEWRPAPDRTFEDVGGLENLKQELRRAVVKPLGPKQHKYERFDIQVPNILFKGPPGTGKSYSAKALAGELGFPMIFLTAGRLQSRWINQSTDHVQDLFREAAKIGDEHGYAVIIAEEIDTLLPRRTKGNKHQEDDKVVTEFLTYLERCNSNNTLFIGITNRPDELDPAATRSGRIDRRFQFSLPDKQTRFAILQKQLSDRPVGISAAKLSEIAEHMEGASAADLSTVTNQAARCAVEDGASMICPKHLEQAIEERFTTEG